MTDIPEGFIQITEETRKEHKGVFSKQELGSLISEDMFESRVEAHAKKQERAELKRQSTEETNRRLTAGVFKVELDDPVLKYFVPSKVRTHVATTGKLSLANLEEFYQIMKEYFTEE